MASDATLVILGVLVFGESSLRYPEVWMTSCHRLGFADGTQRCPAKTISLWK